MLAAGEHILARKPHLAYSIENRHRRIAERHPMFHSHLHSIGGNYPYTVGKIELAPLGSDHLAGARRAQDREFERASTDAALLSKFGHKVSDFSIVERGEMRDAANFPGG